MEENIRKLITEIRHQLDQYDYDGVVSLDTLEEVERFISENFYILDPNLKKNLYKLQILFKINEIKKEIKHPPNPKNDKYIDSLNLDNFDNIDLRSYTFNDEQQIKIIRMIELFKEFIELGDISNSENTFNCGYLSSLISTDILTIPINKHIRFSNVIDCSKNIGIENNGNTCFMNTTLQLLYSIEFFRDYFLQINSEGLDEISCAIKILFNLMYTKNSTDFTINLKNLFIDYNGNVKSLRDVFTLEYKDFKTFNQQDCAEYLQILFEKILLENTNNLDKLFNVYILDIIKCSTTDRSILYRAGSSNIKEIIFNIVQIEIDQHKCIFDIQSLINNNFSVRENPISEQENKNCNILLGDDA